MTDLTRISIISTAESALNKLKKANVCVYDCEKEGARLSFSVKDKDMEKAFAIFSKACYNIKVQKQSKLKRALSFLALRAGLLAGAALFCIIAALSNLFILKIEVSGSGSYLESEVLRIVYDEGAKSFGKYSAFNVSTATGRILALPQVTFCNIQKRGSVLFVDVQTNSEHFDSVNYKPLKSDVEGVVKNISAICGTPAVSVGSEVKKGDTLIEAFTLAGESNIPCIAVGFAEIEYKRSFEYFAANESDESLKEAYSALLLEDENVLEKSYTVKPTESGFIYVIDCVILHKVSINLS